MAALCRLAGRQLCSQMANHERNSLMFIRAVTMKPEPFKPQAVENYDLHNMDLGRPMSPHLTIYSPQLTSMLSITHRGTGCALTLYVMAFGIGSLGGGDFTTFIDGLALSSGTIFMMKSLIALPFSYHCVNGVRHLLWDLGKFLTIKEVYTTGYAMLAGTGALTLFLSCL